MKRKPRNYPMGSVSSGTMRNEDLIPSFLDELEHQVRTKKVSGFKKEINRINQAMEREGYFDSEDASYDLDWLFDSLNEFAAPYFYFGAHPGDGADYGYWLTEGLEDDFDGVITGDLSEVDKDYRGEVLHVNDHGNTSLYVKNTRGFREVWAIV